MKARKADAYSPNQVLLVAVIAAVLAGTFVGRFLWIPASRIPDLHARAVALAVADGVAAFATECRVDGLVPAARDLFLDVTGLAGVTDWDTRYFNRRVGEGATAGFSGSTTLSETTPGKTAVSAVADVAAGVATDAANAGAAGAAGTPSEAAADDTPAMPARPAVSSNAIHSSANPLKVYMFGDSQVYSLGNGLSRLAGKDSPIAVEFLAVHSSGFIRGDYFDWPAKLADTLSAGSYDTAVMMLGMNDYQNFWNSRGEIMKKRTPEWEEAYAEKCSELIDLALLYVPRVYWVGMPRVKDPQYEESLQYIDGVQDRIAARYGPDIVIRCPIADSLPGSGGSFLANVTTPSGKIVQAMSSDGSHFTVEGGQYAMEGLFARMVGDWLFSEIPVEHLPE